MIFFHIYLFLYDEIILLSRYFIKNNTNKKQLSEILIYFVTVIFKSQYHVW